MVSYRIEFKHSAERDLRKLSYPVVSRLLDRIEGLAEMPFPRQSLKLSAVEKTYRLRIGVYRVIYDVDEEHETVTIHYIRHRREAYRNV
ncbi:MAG: type II toxin-antitoxin system RelE/ParE family toxin [Chloroflexi bacterium]|nr:type II toxin-antitoxin system RelE/ParE family toxin [Chloroflexota bacterium]